MNASCQFLLRSIPSRFSFGVGAILRGCALAALVTTAAFAQPVVTSATYNVTSGALAVTGSGLTTGDIIFISKLTFTGEGGSAYKLTTANVTATNATTFSATLTAADKTAVSLLFNKNGTSSTDGTTYNLATADNWDGSAVGDTAVATCAITVSSVSVPLITSATYDDISGTLNVIGSGFSKLSGASNDVVVNKLTLTGEGGGTYTLTTSGVEITSATAFAVTLNPTDKSAVNLLLNKNGASSNDATTYNLAAAEDWAAGTDAALAVADLTGNAVTVAHVTTPTITSATYNASTGALVVTGTGLATGEAIAVSKLTLTGEGGSAYTLTTLNVNAANATTFTVNLNATDKIAINQIFNSNGTSSTTGTIYNLAAADDWVVAVTAGNISSATSGVTVSNVATPAITSAIYDVANGRLSVTGTGFLKLSGATNDVDVTKLTLTGETAGTYTLTTANVEITSNTAFSITLNNTDKTAVNLLLNKNGTSSTGGTTYNLAAAEDWAAGAATAVNVADLVNGVTVVHGSPPTITSATYSSPQLTITGTSLSNSDIIAVNRLTVTGEGGATYTLTTSNVTASSATSVSVTLSPTDRRAINPIFNKNGTSSTGGTVYNLAATGDWNTSVTTETDQTTAAVTVAGVTIPNILGALYNPATGVLAVNGTNLTKRSGLANDIDVSKFTLTGQGGGTYLLTTTGAEITNDTYFTVTLNSTDRSAVNLLLNQDGATSIGGTTYNLAAAEDWAAGADAAVVVADLTGNGIFVSSSAISDLLVFAPINNDNNTRIYKANTDGTLTPVTTIATGLFGNYAAVRGDQAFAYITDQGSSEVSVIDARTFTLVQVVTTSFGGAPFGIAISSDGTRVYVANRTTNTITVFSADTATGLLTLLTTIDAGVGTNPRGIALSLDGSRLYVVNQSGNSLGVIDTVGNTIVATIPVGTQPLSAAVNQSGTRVYVTNFSSNSVTVIDATNNTVITTIPVGGGPDGVVVSPNGAFVYTANRSGGNVTQIDAVTNNLITTDIASGQSANGIAISADGAFLYAANQGASDNLSMYSVSATTGALTSLGTIASGNNPGALGMIQAPGPTLTPPANGRYGLGQTLSFTATYLSAVNVTGTPGITLTIGSTSRTAAYVSGSGTAALVFNYVIQAGDNDTDGIAVVSPVSLNGGTITTAITGFNTGTFFGALNTTGVLVDTTAPTTATIARQTPTSVNTNATSVTYRVTFSKSVTGVDATDFTLTPIGGSATGTISSVTQISPSIYDVTVSSLAGQGQMRLDLNSSGTGIVDLASNPIAAGGFTAGDVFFAGVTSVFDSVSLPLGLTRSVSNATTNLVAQRFTTAAAAPLALTTVQVALGNISGLPNPVATICADISGAIGSVVATLTSSGPLVANTLNVWTTTTTLNSSTTYWLVLADSSSSGGYEVKATAATAGGSGSWLTGSDYVYRYGANAGTGPQAGAFQVALGATSASAPVISSALTASGTVGSAITAYTIVATNSPTSFNATGLPPGLSVDTATGQITGAPTSSSGSPYSVALSATNTGGSGNATLAFTIAAAPLSAPVISSALTASGTVGSAISPYAIVATNSPTSFNATGLPPGLSIDTVTGQITGTPTSSSGSPYSVALSATNTVGSGNATLAFTIAAAPLSAPVITSALTASGTVGNVITPYAIVATNSPTSFNATGLPPGLSIDTATGQITGAPTSSSGSPYSVALSATNTVGSGSATLAFTIAPAPPGTPVITSPLTAGGAYKTAFGGYTIVASGATTYAATGLPPGLSVNVSTGLVSGTPTQSGSYSVTLSATNASSITGSATLNLTISKLALTVSGITAASKAYDGSTTATLSTGGAALISIVAPDTVVLGTNSAVGTFSDATVGMAKVVTVSGLALGGADSGNYTLIQPTTTASITQAPPVTSRIINFSGRALSGPGSQTLIVGFIVSGNGKHLLLRGLGPTLANFGLVNVLADPVLSVYGTTGVVATNDDWGNDAAIVAATASFGGYALPSGSKDSALLFTANNGVTTALLRPNTTAGVGLIEIYDIDTTATSTARLINVSARMNVTANEGTLIAGLIISGQTSKTVLIRGVGPTLGNFAVTGVLADPQITLFSNGTVLASNDNWESGSSSAAQITSISAQVGAFPLSVGSKDAALLVNLPPGAYTVHVSGVGNTTGVALVEVYDTQ